MIAAAMEAADAAAEPDSIFTPRLELMPLTLKAVTALLESRPRKEIEALIGAELPWTWPSRALVDQFFGTSIEEIRKNPRKRLWGDRLMTTRHEPRQVIGSIVFHGYPSEDGRCEVAYGVEDASQGRGYATEALAACIDWALTQPECRIVRATTTAWHRASKRLLEKLGMRLVASTTDGGSEMLVYEIAKGDPRPRPASS
jgi:RimJ/RimL family protein N-acetyltransferase